MLYPSNEELSLREILMTAVLDSGLSYKETVSALNYVLCALRDKGSNLLDSASIQKVATFGVKLD